MRFASIVAGAGLLLFAAIAFPLAARVENAVDVSLSEAHEVLALDFVRILPEPSAAATERGRTHKT
ncbi:MAG TPA: hypothetical protein VM493_06620, partial [Vicinamibacterales bacterium]|nr:hypothetical protein [Vicinamibacterales bacterium]